MMTRLPRYFLLLATFITSARAADLTQDDYDIWNAAIRGRNPDQVVYVWHHVEPLDALHRITLDAALKDFPEARPTAERWNEEADEVDLRL